MAKYSGPNFILEKRLYTEPWQEHKIEKLFYCSEKMYNKVAHYANMQLEKMRNDINYQNILELYLKESDEKIKKQYGAQLTQIRESYGLTKTNFETFVNYQRNHSFKGTIDVDMAQKIGIRVWNATSSCLFGNGKRVHFKKFNTLDSVECKKNTAGIKFKKDKLAVYWNGMILPVNIRKTDYYALEALAVNDIAYCRVVRKPFKSGYKYFVQIVLKGIPPMKQNRAIGIGHVGIDPGTSIIAAVGENGAVLEPLAPNSIKEINNKICKLNRKLDRQRRAANPDNYNPDGTVKKGKKEWKRSNSYIKTLFELKNAYRLRKCYLNEHQSKIRKKIMALGNSFSVEDMNFTALQKKAKTSKKTNKTIEIIDKSGNKKTIIKNTKRKRFGKSLNNNSPAGFITKLKQNLEYFNIKLEEVNRFKFKASQYRHDTNVYEKVPLSQRAKEIDGKVVQRDLYSAYLISNKLDNETIDRTKCISNFNDFIKIQENVITELLLRNKKLPSSMGINN